MGIIKWNIWLHDEGVLKILFESKELVKEPLRRDKQLVCEWRAYSTRSLMFLKWIKLMIRKLITSQYCRPRIDNYRLHKTWQDINAETCKGVSNPLQSSRVTWSIQIKKVCILETWSRFYVNINKVLASIVLFQRVLSNFVNVWQNLICVMKYNNFD